MLSRFCAFRCAAMIVGWMIVRLTHWYEYPAEILFSRETIADLDEYRFALGTSFLRRIWLVFWESLGLLRARAFGALFVVGNLGSGFVLESSIDLADVKRLISKILMRIKVAL